MSTSEISTTESRAADFNDYRHVIGMMFYGGAGSNIGRDLMGFIKPKDSPDLQLFVTNTDAKLLKEHFGDTHNPELRDWQSARALTVHQLGGNEVTQGQGAGGKPEVGKRAAKTEGSIMAMTEFMKSVDQVLLIGGLGGGTGTGAMPVAAKLAKSLRKETLAWVVMPEAEEGRADKATPALDEIREAVPTVMIQNDQTDEWLVHHMPNEEQRRRLTFKQVWQIVNKRALVPMLVNLQETLQKPGDVINSDAADRAAMMEMGHYVILGSSDVKEEDVERVHEMKAEEIVRDLLAGHFQDRRIIKNGVVASITALGPWPKMLTKEIVRGVREEILGKNPNRNLEVHFRNRSKLDGGNMWIATTIVAKDLSDPTTSQGILPAFTSASSALAPSAPGVVEQAVQPSPAEPVAVAARVKSNGTSQASKDLDGVEIRFQEGGKWITKHVEDDLAGRFLGAFNSSATTQQERVKIAQEVYDVTGHRPDMPKWLKPVPNNKRRFGLFHLPHRAD